MKQSEEDIFPKEIEPQLWIYTSNSLKEAHRSIHNGLHKIKHDKGLIEAKADLSRAITLIATALSKL